MNIETISLQGTTEWNEDALVINEQLQLYGVIDGATSLHPYRGPNKETGGYLASQLIKQYLESLNAEAINDMNLKQLVLQANFRLHEQMVLSGINPHDKASLWTTALALIHITDTNIDYAQVGDCMITAVYNDGTIRLVTHDQVAHIDRKSKLIWEEGIRKGITKREDLWELVKPTIVQNKSSMNTMGGYSVMSGEPELANFIEYGRINRNQLKALLIVTDGLFLHPESGNESRDMMKELTQRIAGSTLKDYSEWLFNLEFEDKDCQRYPRFKVSDDKSGIWIQFEQQ
ncbi:protein phosphatase 2C domain-containing protein [Paenibacillus eucommiae]|uniref:Serine/threonine protein phosphatase PrpC n=1 Tax=Paenibacillus eucommiae TaxID=1355755 RepID=A0ABS4J6R6_9BACL|nr:protein phosphatase 2C domain-containing protein [Paenibacillus eucommiae]MBP1995556.1 serine/threonine protein phosphatase PrpC [Paenibacillus eucommiae]